MDGITNITPKILVVGSSHENISAMKAILKEISTEIHSANSSNEALTLMLKNRYAIVLSNVNKSENRLELVKAMRENPDTALTPVVFVTVENHEEVHIHREYDAHAVDYLLRPLDKKIIVSKVYFLVELQKRLMALERKSSILRKKQSRHRKKNINARQSYSKPTVLIINDKEKTIVSIKKIIKKIPINIVIAKNEQKAISLIRKEKVSLILFDTIMLKIDSDNIIKKIRLLNTIHFIPIIFIISANKNIEQRFNLQQTCIDDYILKPIDPAVLISKVKILSQLHRNKLILEKLINEKETKLDKIQEKNNQLNYLAYHDPLTTLANRGGFDATLKKKLENAARYKRNLALLLIDIDHFKMINDTYGHDHGDMLLQEVSKRIQSAVHKTDYVARIGGDEFAVILEQVNTFQDAGHVAENIVNKLSTTFCILGKEMRMSLSIGIACFSAENTEEGIVSSKILLRNADIAMFRAKEKRNNYYEYYTPEFSAKHRNRLLLENSLKFAIERDEFFLVYQPKIDLMSKTLIGVEALLRWQHPEKGLILPGEFVSIMEETQMIIPAGEWVIRRVFQQSAFWNKNLKIPIKIAINLSGYQLLNQGFIALIQTLVAEYKVNPKLIEFEFTETAIMDELSVIQDAIFQLSNLHFTISIDDFGTGYSMLRHLKKLPIKAIKIDLEFIKDVHNNINSAMIVRAIIDLARNFNLQVIAEGVETQEQEKFLLDNQCCFAQGYLYSYPLLPDDLMRYIEKTVPVP